MAFSDRSIRALTPKSQPYRVHEGASDKGFCVQVTPAGTKIFEQQYTFLSRRRFMRLGTYPDTSLAGARQNARKARRLIDQGLDPQEAAARTRNENRIKGSVNQLFDGYLAQMESSGKRSVKEVARSLQTDARPYLGSLPAREITPAHIRDVPRQQPPRKFSSSSTVTRWTRSPRMLAWIGGGPSAVMGRDRSNLAR